MISFSSNADEVLKRNFDDLAERLDNLQQYLEEQFENWQSEDVGRKPENVNVTQTGPQSFETVMPIRRVERSRNVSAVAAPSRSRAFRGRKGRKFGQTATRATRKRGRGRRRRVFIRGLRQILTASLRERMREALRQGLRPGG